MARDDIEERGAVRRKQRLRQKLRQKAQKKRVTARSDVWEQAKELLGLPTGAYWVCREGDMNGPLDERIPSWCDGVGGLRADAGIWHPTESLGAGKVLWKRLIYPVTPPSPLEQIAEIARGEE
jgi:hypothetical protein